MPFGLIVFSVAALLAAGPRGARMVELNETLAGQPVAVARGEQMRVMLHESGGTGYRWRVGDGCSSLLHLDEELASTPGEVPGAGRERTWRYTAREAGSCELRFELARSWEKTVTGKVVVFPVTVQAK